MTLITPDSCKKSGFKSDTIFRELPRILGKEIVYFVSFLKYYHQIAPDFIIREISLRFSKYCLCGQSAESTSKETFLLLHMEP